MAEADRATIFLIFIARNYDCHSITAFINATEVKALQKTWLCK
jgi:hypothetical protein